MDDIEGEEEHDPDKINEAMRNLDNHEGCVLNKNSEFVVLKKLAGSISKYVTYDSQKLNIAGEKAPLGSYIVGRTPNTSSTNPRNLEFIIYSLQNGRISKDKTGQSAPAHISRFDLIILNQDNQIEIFNIGRNELELEVKTKIKF